MFLKLFLILLFLFTSQTSFSFVENVTHGYPACISCHVSPSGGGLLTDYGRSLSQELMSTWNTGDSFVQPFLGALKNSEKVKWGGDIRTIQTYLDNKNINRGELFPMQQNIEVGVTQSALTFVGTLGLQQGTSRTPERGTFLSERHYLLWQTSETSRLRIGKFRQTFGINTPNHTRLIKNSFGFGFLSEKYNLEYTKFYETFEITVGSSLGRIDKPNDLTSEKSISSSMSYYLNDNSRIGGSYLIGESNSQRRNLFSLNAVLPFAKDWIGLFEVDYEDKDLNLTPQNNLKTFSSFTKIGNQAFKGFMWYLFFEHSSIDSSAPYQLTHSPGLGIQWLPISHVNIQFEYLRQVSSAPATLNANSWSNPNNIGWLLFHIYL